MDLSLQGYATAVVRAQPPADLAGLADQLESMLEVVNASPALATTLSDVTVPVEARQAVLRDLFERRVSPPAFRLVAQAVRVERAPEVLPALHDLTELVRLRAERPNEADIADDRPLGHSALRRVLAGMAAAELETVADVGRLETIEDELFRFARTVGANPPLRSALADWSVPGLRRAELTDSLLAGKAQPETVRLAAGAVRLRTRDVVAVLDWLAEQVAAARGWRVAQVRAAMELDEGERQRLGEAMARLTGRPVEVQVTVDPALIGGAQVTIGDLLVDASTRHRLDQLQEQLGGPEGAIRSLIGDGG